LIKVITDRSCPGNEAKHQDRQYAREFTNRLGGFHETRIIGLDGVTGKLDGDSRYADDKALLKGIN
jgi:hypothetical protein